VAYINPMSAQDERDEVSYILRYVKGRYIEDDKTPYLRRIIYLIDVDSMDDPPWTNQ
jgi:hypothetical protein